MKKTNRANNEMLLAWSDYEVIKARMLLHNAEAYNEILVQKGKEEKEEKEKEAHDMNALTRKLCNFIDQVIASRRIRNKLEIVYGISEEDFRMVNMNVDAQKAFWRRCGVSEEQLSDY